MVLGYIQKTIAERIGSDKPKDITLDYSFIDNKRMSEDDFFDMLEELEVEMQMELVNHAWKFETVNHLVEFIRKNS